MFKDTTDFLNKLSNLGNLKLQITIITQMSAALVELISAARLFAYIKNTFPYALCNLTFKNKLLVKGQNKRKKLVSL